MPAEKLKAPSQDTLGMALCAVLASLKRGHAPGCPTLKATPCDPTAPPVLCDLCNDLKIAEQVAEQWMTTRGRTHL